jgi:hypothetical protein
MYQLDFASEKASPFVSTNLLEIEHWNRTGIPIL